MASITSTFTTTTGRELHFVNRRGAAVYKLRATRTQVAAKQKRGHGRISTCIWFLDCLETRVSRV